MLKGNTSHISQTLTFSHPIAANRGTRYYFVSHYHFADRERTPQILSGDTESSEAGSIGQDTDTSRSTIVDERDETP